MLINARQPEETRIAIVDNVQLIDLDIESIDKEQKKANIYKAKISRIESSLNAVFVNYGEDKNGFLPFKEIASEYFKKSNQGQDLPLNELLDVGQELIVQISKEERGTKGAALTTFITLAGCYMVLMPNNPNTGGISRRIEGNERQQLKVILESLKIPTNMGVIIRTAGVGHSIDEIQTDLDTLTNLWDAIKHTSYQRKAPFLIHKESSITIRAIRDHLKDDIKEIIVDDEESYEDLQRQLSILHPNFIKRLQLYTKELPLFNTFKIEKQIESAFKREIQLPSKGSIIIDTTEALTAIDINSARSTKGENIEETAFATNLEAAEEIARQLRLRDLGGLIVVDFIDMAFFPNQKVVEQKLVDALFHDRARIQMTRISKFGLVEISRQRLQASLGESIMLSCPRCAGHGFIRSIPSLALSILRDMHAEGLREKTNELRVQLPVEVATFLLNEKRDEISQIEGSTNTKLTIIPNTNLQSPNYSLQRIWGDSYTATRQSFDLIENKKDIELYKAPKKNKDKQPALKSNQYNQMESRPHNNSSMPEKPSKFSQNFFVNGFWRKITAIFLKKEQESTIVEEKNYQKKSLKHTKNERNINRSNQSEQRDLRINNRYNDNKKQSETGIKRKDHQRNQEISQSKSSGTYNNSYRGNDKDKANNSKTNNRSNNQRLQIHPNNEVIDILSLKQNSPKAIKAAKDKAIMKNISTIPQEKISTMVKEVLAASSTLKNDKFIQIKTKTSNTYKTKYLNFEKISIEEELSKTKQKNKEKSIKKVTKEIMEENTKSPFDKKEIKEKQKKQRQTRQNSRKEALYINYSPAVDETSQGYILTS